ncbi:MAG: protein O-mannosyl-transferase family [Anaerolineae bacterium]
MATGMLSLALYLPLVPRAVLEGDPGEFQFAPYLGGIVHPTGYPLYCIIGWLWSHALPIGDAAYRMNLLSAVLAACAVGMVCRTGLYLSQGMSRWVAWPAAAAASLAFATSPTFWSQSIVAEVYSLHALILAALLLATLVVAQRLAHPAEMRPPPLWLPALVAGIGLTHHSTTVLFLPGCALAIVAAGGLRTLHRPAPRDLALAAVALVAPLLLYTYLPLRAPRTPYLVQRLGDGLSLFDNSPAGLLTFVLGGPFGSALTLDGLPARLLVAGRRALNEMNPLLWGLAAAGAVALWSRRRAAALALITGLVLQVAFSVAYNIGDVQVMYIPVYLVVAILAAVGITAAARVEQRAILAPALAVAVAVTVLLRLPQAQAAAEASVPAPPADRWPSLLADAPADAVLVSNDRNEIMPLWYYQYVDGRRQDVTGLFPLIVTDPGYADLGGVLDRALASGRDVYLIKPMPGIEVGYQVDASGPPVRVFGAQTDRASQLLEATLGGQVALLGYTLSDEQPRPGLTLDVTLYWQPATALAYPYSTYVHVVHEDGSVPWPGSDRRPGGDYYPATLWKPGQVIADVHGIAVPADAVPGTYRLIAGMYAYPSLASLGDSVTLGEFRVQ